METHEPPNSTMAVTLSASTRVQYESEHVMAEPAVEFSLIGQYAAAVKLANSLKLSSKSSDIPVAVLSM